jgi:hypothetical protein
VKPPDVLVLGAGGTLGEAWLSGFLAGAGQQGTHVLCLGGQRHQDGLAHLSDGRG